MTDESKKILIIKPSALGDIVLAMPAACMLRQNFPGAYISWMVRPEFAPLLEGHPAVDELILFDRKRLGKWWRSAKSFNLLVELVKQLRAGNFDFALDLQGLLRSAIFAFLSGSPQRIGTADIQERSARWFYNKLIDSNEIHLVDRFMNLAQATGAKRTSVEYGLKVDDAAKQQIASLLAENKADENKYAVLVPGSAVPAKNWPADKYAELANRLANKFGLHIITTGTKSEQAVISAVAKNIHNRNKFTDLAGQTTLKQLIALLAGAKIVISNDTGPGHIAAALGTPMVMIFGYTNPLRVGPYGRPDCVAAVDAFNRGKNVESADPLHSVENVTVDMVWEKILWQIQHI